MTIKKNSFIIELAIILPLLYISSSQVSFVNPGYAGTLAVSPGELAAYKQAAAYSRAHRGISMLVMKDGAIVFEDYPHANNPDEAHIIYSGTKSFSCAIAVAAIQDKLLTFDEPVSHTITEWQGDAQKSKVTIRQLLTLTSGIDAGKSGSAPTYANSIKARMLRSPGTYFQYGPVPFQIFGELMRRKLKKSGERPREYLMRRILDPIGLKIASWRTTSDGNPKMSGGAFLSAREWAKYGQLILNGGQWAGKQILDGELLSECFHGTAANPGYGVAFWLPMNGGTDSEGRSTNRRAEKLKSINAPTFIIKAAGIRGQKLYIISSRNLVIVRQASSCLLWGWGFDDAEFLAPLFKKGGRNSF